MAGNHPDYAAMSPGELADRLGQIKAEIAELTRTERAMKDAFIDKGVSEAEGERFRVVKFTQTRDQIDMAAAKAKLGAAWLKRHTTVSTSTIVKVTARIRVD